MDNSLKIVDVLEELESTIQNYRLENSFKSCLFLSKDVLRSVEDEIANAKYLAKECIAKQCIENNSIPMVVINKNDPLKEEVICDQNSSYSDRYQEYSYGIVDCLEQNLNTKNEDEIRIGAMDIKDDCSLSKKDIDDYCMKLEESSEWLNNHNSSKSSNKTLIIKHRKSRGWPQKERTNTEKIKKKVRKEAKEKYNSSLQRMKLLRN